MLTAIVVALGASFGDEEAHHFGVALYDKVKGLILNVRHTSYLEGREEGLTFFSCTSNRMNSRRTSQVIRACNKQYY